MKWLLLTHSKCFWNFTPRATNSSQTGKPPCMGRRGEEGRGEEERRRGGEEERRGGGGEEGRGRRGGEERRGGGREREGCMTPHNQILYVYYYLNHKNNG